MNTLDGIVFMLLHLLLSFILPPLFSYEVESFLLLCDSPVVPCLVCSSVVVMILLMCYVSAVCRKGLADGG